MMAVGRLLHQVRFLICRLFITFGVEVSVVDDDGTGTWSLRWLTLKTIIIMTQKCRRFVAFFFPKNTFYDPFYSKATAKMTSSINQWRKLQITNMKSICMICTF
jgi:hypothetical protein